VGITSSDPEEAGRRENDRARVDLWRTIAFLDIALLAGIGATGGFLDPLPSSIHLLEVSVALNLSGLLLALFALALASGAVGAEADEDPEYVVSLRRWRERVGVVAYTGFGLSVLTFLVFVGNNLNALRP
jgi:putative copper export protein